MFLPKIEHRKTFLKSGSLSNEKKHSTVHDDTSLLSLGKRYFAGFQLGDSWDIMLLRFVLGFSTLVFRSSFSLVLEEKFEFTPKYVGYLTSYQGGVSTIAGFLVGHLTLLDSNEIHQTFIGILALFLALSGLTISTTVFSLVCSLTLLCIATSFLRVCLSNLLSSRCSKEKMGAVFGLGQSVTSVARMLAPVAGGLALELGPHGPGLVGAVSSGIGLLCCCLFLKSSKQKTN